MNVMSAANLGTQAAARWRTAILLAAGLFVISGLVLGLYQSFFFEFSHFYAFQPICVGLFFSLFHVAYFTLAVPAVLFHRQFGYKVGFLLGLSSFALSAFLLYLAVVQRSSGFFLSAVAMSLISASAFLSILYPTVLGSALDRHRTHIKVAAGLLLAAAGIGSALSAWSANLALNVLLVNPRAFVCFALPFLGVVLAYARTTSAARKAHSEQPVFSR
jgi:fucose permease